jgi:hypothetical protein
MPEYRVWSSMKSRCLNPRDTRFDRYGGRGISVCARWLSFDCFLADMGPRPSMSHSIERVDIDGNYEPSNCKWATPVEQARNTRRTARWTFRGETRSAKEWSEILGIPYQTLMTRVHVCGWTVERALATKHDARKVRHAG